MLIPTWLGDDIGRYCLAEELAKVLGLRVDAYLNTYSIINDDDRYTDLTPTDELML